MVARDADRLVFSDALDELIRFHAHKVAVHGNEVGEAPVRRVPDRDAVVDLGVAFLEHHLEGNVSDARVPRFDPEKARDDERRKGHNDARETGK